MESKKALAEQYRQLFIESTKENIAFYKKEISELEAKLKKATFKSDKENIQFDIENDQEMLKLEEEDLKEAINTTPEEFAEKKYREYHESNSRYAEAAKQSANNDSLLAEESRNSVIESLENKIGEKYGYAGIRYRIAMKKLKSPEMQEKIEQLTREKIPETRANHLDYAERCQANADKSLEDYLNEHIEALQVLSEKEVTNPETKEDESTQNQPGEE